MTSVLVTGANGLLGRPLVRALLRRGLNVHAVSRQPQPAMDGVQWHVADLLDAAASTALMQTVRPAQLVHLAWVTEHGQFWSSPDNARWLDASQALIRAFSEAGGERLLGVGSCAEYDWTRLEPGGYCDEARTPLAPHTAYGRAKAALWDWAQRHCAEACVAFAWARLFHLFGPGEPPRRLVPSVIRSLLDGEPAKCSDGEQRRDFTHVDDIAEQMADLLLSMAQGAFNLGSGQTVRVAELIQRIAGEIGQADLVQLGALPRPAGDPDALLPRLAAMNTHVTHRVAPLQDRLRATIDEHRASTH